MPELSFELVNLILMEQILVPFSRCQFCIKALSTNYNNVLCGQNNDWGSKDKQNRMQTKKNDVQE